MPTKARNSQDAVGIKEALCGLLDKIESGGSTVTAGVYPEAPLPDLFLRGYGPVPLPLTQRDAEGMCKERTEGDEGEESMETGVAIKCSEILLQRMFLRWRSPLTRSLGSMGNICIISGRPEKTISKFAIPLGINLFGKLLSKLVRICASS